MTTLKDAWRIHCATCNENAQSPYESFTAGYSSRGEELESLRREVEELTKQRDDFAAQLNATYGCETCVGLPKLAGSKAVARAAFKAAFIDCPEVQECMELEEKEADELRDEVKQLRREVEELKAQDDPMALHITYLSGKADRNQKLAASQAREQKLREAIERELYTSWECTCHHFALNQILSIPSDNTALIEFADKVREKCAELAETGRFCMGAVPSAIRSMKGKLP